ncbi:hypothetical protein UFOVP665_33 [uncultured Caudovirales phage]|uniref:CHRD domain-containing protein n=1 Tax=uncultured Caudovirales phage TaxID=2100421 RepID=A0A6J5NGC2_9CAUD|nr:hypothetical protein UFOVP665_33 [uncultured Caudovirales phage]
MNNTSNTNPVKSIALTGADQAVATAQVFYGIVITNESGASMNIHVHNGANGSGTPIIAGLHVNNNDSEYLWFGPNGVNCPSGIWIDVVSGTPTGSVLYR